MSYIDSDEWESFMGSQYDGSTRPLIVTDTDDGGTRLQVPGESWWIVLGPGFGDEATDEVSVCDDGGCRQYHVENTSGFLYLDDLAPEDDQRKWVIVHARWW